MNIRNAALAVLAASCAACAPRICVVPGETVSMPTPITNEADPGGGATGALKLVVVSQSAAFTRPVESASESVLPGETKTFTPRFTVDPQAKPDDKIDLLLRTVGSVAGSVPDPEPDRAVHFVVKNKCSRFANPHEPRLLQ